VVISYIFARFGMLHLEKSGNPVLKPGLPDGLFSNQKSQFEE
jgi:hypothetical protein